MKIELGKRHIGLSLLVFACIGLPLAGGDSGCSWQTKDPATGQWRDATPTEMTGFAHETGAIVRTTLSGTPLAPVLPWMDMALRLLALGAAWRVIPSAAKVAAAPTPTPPGPTHAGT